MTEHMSYLSNMTCVMREMNMIDNNNNIDVAAMKAEANNKYKVHIYFQMITMITFREPRCQVNGSSRDTSQSWIVATKLPRTFPLILTMSMTSRVINLSATLEKSRAS